MIAEYQKGIRNGRMSSNIIAVVVLISITGTWLQNGCVAELYTALADMEELLETEAVLIDTLNGYIKAQEERLATLRKWVLQLWLAHGFGYARGCLTSSLHAGYATRNDDDRLFAKYTLLEHR